METAETTDGRGGRGRDRLVVYVGEVLHEALNQWAIAEHRSGSGQARKVLDDAVPAKYVLAAQETIAARTAAAEAAEGQQEELTA